MEIEELYQKYLESGKVSTDTRQITPGSVFFALKGPTFDGNRFASEAISRGASYAVVDDPSITADRRCLLFEDSLTTLQQLARHHRTKLKIPVIALTGSNGKTTSKELVSAVLSTSFRTNATRGNLNNHIGVPVTLLSINPQHEIAVVEMGANHVGEIAGLCEIASPTHGFITNIGKAHLGTFGGFENIIRGKSELYQYLISHGGQVFINSRDPILANMAKRFAKPLLYPAKGDYYHCALTGDGTRLTVIAENGDTIHTQLSGHYNFENVAVSLAVGKFFGVDPHKANEAVAAYKPGNMRSQVIQKGTNRIILDAYNANPTSMAAAVTNLSMQPEPRKIAILGDMFELEGEAESEHAQLGTWLGEKGIKEALLCGKWMAAAGRNFPAGKHFETKSALIDALKENPITGAVVLVKASRGMALEEVVEYL